MTPEEKAKEIFSKYWLFFVEDTDAIGIHKLAKQCAVIAVDEILKIHKKLDLSTLEYYTKVRLEIIKL